MELLAAENFHSQFHAHHPSYSSQGVYRGIYAIGKALLVKLRIVIVGIALTKKLSVEVVRQNEPIYWFAEEHIHDTE